MALHAGEISYDEHGTTATSVNLAFRLSDAQALKAALAASPGVLAVIASSWFFQEVVRHNPACNADAYRRVRVAVKETTTVAWIHLPDHSYSSGCAAVMGLLGDKSNDHEDIRSWQAGEFRNGGNLSSIGFQAGSRGILTLLIFGSRSP
jgi:hypothetical protein